MAGGPIFPFSAIPATADRTFASTIITGSNSFIRSGMGVEASVGADSEWHLLYKMPPALPTGDPKTVMQGFSAAVAGSAQVNFYWASKATEEDLDLTLAGLNAEGTETITWAAGDDYVIKELRVDLDADTVIADEYIIAIVVFETTSWTLASVSLWDFPIIWE